MKLLLLNLILLLTVPALAQESKLSVCAEGLEKKTYILSICDYGKGRTALPRARLYLRVYTDGTVEYEESVSKFDVKKHTLKLTADQVWLIQDFGDSSEFHALRSDYSDLDKNKDYGLDNIIVFNFPQQNTQKRIELSNYIEGEKENDTRYPAKLNALMKLASSLRDTSRVVEPHVLPPPDTRVKKTDIIEYGKNRNETRTLEVGKTYRGKVNFGTAYGMHLTPFPKLPYHHSVMYRWPNVKDFPALDPDKDYGVRTIVFTVTDKEVDNFRKNNWITTFTIDIISVE